MFPYSILFSIDTISQAVLVVSKALFAVTYIEKMSATIGINFTCKPFGSFIDRLKPAILGSYMSDSVWDKFCDDVDEKFAVQTKYIKAVFLSFGITFVLGFAAYLLGGGYFNALIAIGVVLFIYFLVVYIRASNQSMKDLETVIDDINKTYQGQVTFHLRTISVGEGVSHHIAVSINESGGAGASSEAKDVATRLEDLEKVKHLISDQEYEDKRRDILSDA